MRKLNYLFSILLAVLVITATSCKKDSAPTYQVIVSAIDGANYSGDGTLAFSFSTDGGTTWAATAPATMKEGAILRVKITDGTKDLTTDEFDFDWSASSGNASSNTAATVEFTMGSDLTVTASVSEIMDMVLVKRSTGVLYSVDRATGDTTRRGVIVNGTGGPAIVGLRALVYDPKTGGCFAGSTNSDNGNFYSINITTGVADLLNDNPGQTSRDGISGVLMGADGNVLVHMYSNILNNSAVATFNKSTGVEGTHNVLASHGNDGWSTGGLIYGATENQLILGGDNEIYFANLPTNDTCMVTDTTVLVPSANISAYMYVQDLKRDTKTGTVYSIIQDNDNTGYQYLATINTSTGAITEIKLLAGSSTKEDWFHCLAFIPRHRLPKV